MADPLDAILDSALDEFQKVGEPGAAQQQQLQSDQPIGAGSQAPAASSLPSSTSTAATAVEASKPSPKAVSGPSPAPPSALANDASDSVDIGEDLLAQMQQMLADNPDLKGIYDMIVSQAGEPGKKADTPASSSSLAAAAASTTSDNSSAKGSKSSSASGGAASGGASSGSGSGSSSSSSKPAASQAAGLNSFEESMRQAMAGLAQNAQAAPMEGDLSRMMEEAMSELMDSDLDVDALMDGLLSKEIMYPSLMEVGKKYPAWLQANGSKLADDQRIKYEKQLHCITQICAIYEKDDMGEKAQTEKVMALMEEMQKYGAPPPEVTEGMPNMASMPAGAGENCSVM